VTKSETLVLEEYDMITVLAGGTGSVKLVRGLVAQESKVNVISNVGDNYWLYGLYVCPDIDTIVYGLADLLDQERGWGMKKDTFNFLRQMEVFGLESETEMLQLI
jgi:LPPG:FO 2-phospho-L-lactate transferase